MPRSLARGLVVAAALLVSGVSASLAVSAASLSAHPHRHRPPISIRRIDALRVRWRRVRPTLIGEVLADGSTGGIFGTGAITIEGPFGRVTTLTLDGLTRAWAAGEGPEATMGRIDPASIPVGAVVVIRGELVNTGPLYVALRIFDTGFIVPAPTPTPTPTATPSATPTPTPAPSPLRVIGRVRATDSGTGGMFGDGTLVVRAPSGRWFLFEMTAGTTACVYHGPVEGCSPISPTAIHLGDEVIVRGLTIPGRPHVFQATAIVDITPGIEPRPTLIRVIGRAVGADDGSGGTFDHGTLVVQAPSGRSFLFEVTAQTSACAYHGPVAGCSRIDPTAIRVGDSVLVRGRTVPGSADTFAAGSIVDITLGTRPTPGPSPALSPTP